MYFFTKGKALKLFLEIRIVVLLGFEDGGLGDKEIEIIEEGGELMVCEGVLDRSWEHNWIIKNK